MVDIFDYGFDKNLNRGRELPTSVVYNTIDQSTSESVKFSVFGAGSGTSVIQFDPSKGQWMGAAKFDDAPFSIDMEGSIKATKIKVVSIKSATIFEDISSGRISISSLGSGTATIAGSVGLAIQTNTTATSYGYASIIVSSGSFNIYDRSPKFSILMNGQDLDINTVGASGNCFVGIGTISATGGAMNFTVEHIGFKFLKTDGVTNLYATQSDDTTENVSSSLGTAADATSWEFFVAVNKFDSVDYFYARNGGSFKTVRLTGNVPTFSSSNQIRLITSNVGTAFNNNFIINSVSYER